MKKFNFRKYCWFLIYIMTLNLVRAELAFKNIADLYLKSFKEEGGIIENNAISLKDLSSKSEGSKVSDIRPPKLDPRVVRELIFNTILEKTYLVKEYLSSKQKILNKYSYGDLRIFYGTTTDSSYSLFNNIKRTETLIGECVLATILATPSNDHNEIEKKQDIIKVFLSQEEKCIELNKILSNYSKIENSLLSFYSANDPFYSKTWQDFMNDYYFYGAGSDKNKDAQSLELKKRIKMDFWNIFYEFTYPVYWNSLYYLFLNMIPGIGDYSHLMSLYRSPPFSGLGYKYKIAQYGNRQTQNEGALWTYIAVEICFEASYVYYFIKAVKLCSEHTKVLNNLAMRMRDVQIFFKLLIELDKTISSSPELNKKYGNNIKHIRALLARKDDQTELGNLIKYILEMPLNRKWQYFLNNTGKLLAAYSLLVEHKDHLVNAMAEVGELDATFSIVKLYKESRDYDTNNCYNFVKLLPLEDNIVPVLNIEGMWHPLIDAKTAVNNDLSMNENLRTIVLTGPNAGGKSTYLTNIAICVIMGQSFGIAPVKNIDFTIFSKISSYIDISDDIIEGNSLFKAEVRRAQEHTQMLVGLKSHEFALTLFDEPFSGTNPSEGAAAEYSILLSLARFKASFTIVATHFPLVMLLEDNNPDRGFANYRVSIDENSDKLSYSYKILRGKSTQAIAIRILEEEGFDISLLQRAKDIIRNPDNYKAKFE